jgi:hypothetical protein
MVTEVRRRRWRRLGPRGKEAAAAGCAEPRARDGGFIGRPWGLGMRAQSSARRRRPCRAVAGLGVEPESGSRSGTTPTGGPRLSVREKERREKGHAGGLTGPEDRRVQAAAGLGRAGRKEKKEGQLGLGRMEEKERGRKKMGQAKRGKREREKKECIQMHLNLNLKFKFK